MNFDAQILNFHDFFLALTIFLSLLLAILISVTPNKDRLSKLALVAFIVIFGLVHLQRLFLFSDVFNQWILAHSTDLMFAIAGAYWLQPPLLYLYTRSVVHKRASWRRADLLHFFPVILFCVYLYVTFWRFDSVTKVYLVEDYRFYNSVHYVVQNYLRTLHAIFYVSLSLVLIQTVVPNKNLFASKLDKKCIWLLLLLLGYLFAVLFRMTGYTIGALTSYGFVADFIGLASMYYELILLCLYIAVSYHLLPKISKEPLLKRRESPRTGRLNDKRYQAIIDYFEKDKPFLDPNTNLQQISEHLDIPSRTLSTIIKQWSEKNFYEFLSFYRVKEAKKLLEQYSAKEKSISVIYEMCGFNNRVAFNNAFKKHVGSTATDFRNQFH